ncbi:hypothetical protein BUALT_Bualt10G0039900 [Buddleja alternifolia]|uniref:NOT2/NOT3/NOT5 C-terminal domain-containing protein n=1 Tax=Buddleja alternifolia TaxID=168488 RepID=A0AAV6WVX4_9LAMI|nr:hypothetical protein BUALT_Bualt10G0039900 [Buddleja alternifolia]
MMAKFIASAETRMANQDASIQNLETQIGQLSNLVSGRQQGALPSDTENNLREAKAITLREGKQLEDPHSNILMDNKTPVLSPIGEQSKDDQTQDTIIESTKTDSSSNKGKRVLLPFKVNVNWGGIEIAIEVNKILLWEGNDLLRFGLRKQNVRDTQLQSALNGSNSNLPDSTGRAFATSFSAQSGSSGAVLNQSGGNIQGLHNIHGSFNMSNMPGPYASRNSTNLGGLPNGVQQAPGNVTNGRYAINSLPNALSQWDKSITVAHLMQLSLGSSHGHSGVTNTGGPGVLPNMGNTGRVTNSIGGIVGGGNTSRGANSGGVATIPGLASRLNLTVSAPQVVSMLGNSYSGAGVPLSQNQFQGNNHFSFMALLNDSNAHDNATFDVNDFPQLSGRPSSGGSQGQLEQVYNCFISFPLCVTIGGLNVGGAAEYTINTHQKEQLHDNMTNLMQSQQLSMGRSPGFNFGGSYSSHHPQQQHRPSSISGTGVSYLSSGNQDLHFHGPEQYQQFQQSQSRFINPFRDKEMKSTQGSQSVPDQYGMLGLLSIIKMINPSLTSLALGIDLTTLGLNLNSPETLHKKFASPWSDEPVRGEPEFSVPECYYAKQTPALKQTYFARFRPETLFYIFYSMPKDEAQLFAANELCNRGWFYHKELRLWFMRGKNTEPLVKTSTYERGCYFCFDPNTWQTIRKDNFVLHYEMVEKRPLLPQ